MKHQNVPPELHQDKRHVMAFFQGILDGQGYLILVGMRVKQGSTVLPDGYLRCSGQVVNKSDYEDLWRYAQNDSTFTTTATTITLPVDATFIVRVV